MDTYARQLLERMIRIDSVLPHEAKLAALIADEIRSYGVEPEWHEVAPGRPNVYAVAELGPKNRFLTFSGHSDTVGPASDWATDPLEPVERDGKLYGLGAINMKAGLACMLAALKSLIEDRASHDGLGRLGVAVVVDQEGHSLGAREMLKTKHAACDAMLHAEHFYGDSDKHYLPIAVTGKVLYKLTVRGKAAHAFRPHLGGINAIDDTSAIVAALDRMHLREHPLFGRGTVCTLRIEGGSPQYSIVVPEQCEVTITRLTVPGETVETAVADMRQLIDSLGLRSSVDVETPPPCYEPYSLDPKARIVTSFDAAYEAVLGKPPCFAGHKGIVDANVFVAEGGIPTVVFGPKGANHHCAGEYVELATLGPVIEVYRQTAISYFEY
jgi:acetylornithine deacetylase/succinyl-diaminopimelate desuccinylase-like protein